MRKGYIIAAAVACAVSACAPCSPYIADGATRGWCGQITVVAHDCPEETADAVALWDVGMAMGDHGQVSVRLGTLSQYGGVAGMAYSRWSGRTTIVSDIVVIQCDVQLIAHELGHALGYAHIDDERSIMYSAIGPDSWVFPGRDTK